jgi:hypothetical protein
VAVTYPSDVRGLKFSGSPLVSSRNRLLRIQAMSATSTAPIDTRNPTQPHPEGLRSYPSGELVTVYFREFLFSRHLGA